MLTKISDTAWIDFDELLLVDYWDDKLRVMFKLLEPDWIILQDHLHKPFLASLEKHLKSTEDKSS